MSFFSEGRSFFKTFFIVFFIVCGFVFRESFVGTFSCFRGRSNVEVLFRGVGLGFCLG